VACQPGTILKCNLKDWWKFNLLLKITHTHTSFYPPSGVIHLEGISQPYGSNTSFFFWFDVYIISLSSVLMLSSHLRLCLPSGLFPTRFLAKSLYVFLMCPIKPSWPSCPILLEWNTAVSCVEVCYIKMLHSLSENGCSICRMYSNMRNVSNILTLKNATVHITLDMAHQMQVIRFWWTRSSNCL